MEAYLELLRFTQEGFEKFLPQIMLISITLLSFAQAKSDLHNVASRLGPWKFIAAFFFRLSVLLIFYVIIRSDRATAESVPVNIALILFSNVLFTGNLLAFGGTGLGAAYHRLIVAADRIQLSLHPLASTKLAILNHFNSITELRAHAKDVIEQFRNDAIRRAFESELTSYSDRYGNPTSSPAAMLVRLVHWSRLFGVVPNNYRSIKSVTDAQQILSLGLKLSQGVSIEDLITYIRQVASIAEASDDFEAAEWDDRTRRTQILFALLDKMGSTSFTNLLLALPAAINNANNATPHEAPVPAEHKQRPPWKSSIKLVSLELTNIRCFESATFDFSDGSGSRAWTLLLGDNGLGKSTVLRSIAIALCDPAGASALMKSLSGEFIRKGASSGSIHLRLSVPDSESSESWCRTTISRVGPGGALEVTQERSDWFPRDHLFICGYGAMRSGFGTHDYGKYSAEDALRSLFDMTHALQNPELALRRMESAGEDINRVCTKIEEILLLQPGSVSISQSGFSVRGPWGEFVPAGAIGDGYQATLAWIADLLGWSFLFNSSYLTEGISGIVLIDEIEKHLHPRWQRRIISQLNQQFSKVQFVATTHAPLCAGGLADLGTGMGFMYRLFSGSSGAVEVEGLDPFVGLRYDQIVTSELFGLPSARDETTEKIILDLQSARDSGDEVKADGLRRELMERSLTVAESERDREVRERFVKKLEELSSEGSP